jgi:hypothetical protein
MKNKVLFKVGGISVDTKTLLTVAGVVAGIVAIKKLTEKESPKKLTSETAEAAEEMEQPSFFEKVFNNYVDEGFMGLGGDEFVKLGGGRPIAFANAGGTENAIYEPNFYNSDGTVPVATDEPNFANSDGVLELGAEVSPNEIAIARRRGIFGRKRRKAADIDGSIGVGAKRKRAKMIAKARAKGMPIGTIAPPVAKGRKKRGIRAVEVSQDQ